RRYPALDRGAAGAGRGDRARIAPAAPRRDRGPDGGSIGVRAGGLRAGAILRRRHEVRKLPLRCGEVHGRRRDRQGHRVQLLALPAQGLPAVVRAAHGLQAARRRGQAAHLHLQQARDPASLLRGLRHPGLRVRQDARRQRDGGGERPLPRGSGPGRLRTGPGERSGILTAVDPGRAAWLVEALGLGAHPEGGHYRRIHAASIGVLPSDGRGERPALTCIHYLLAAGECSRWHRVASDEAWHYIEGAPLVLLGADPGFTEVESRLLGPFGPGAEPVRVVPHGRWRAARPTGPYTLVACTVGPGCVFADFEL